jgi:hypothetical protein
MAEIRYLGPDGPWRASVHDDTGYEHNADASSPVAALCLLADKLADQIAGEDE